VASLYDLFRRLSSAQMLLVEGASHWELRWAKEDKNRSVLQERA